MARVEAEATAPLRKHIELKILLNADGVVAFSATDGSESSSYGTM